MKQIVRLFVYIWAFPTTFLGLLFLLPTFLTRGSCQVVQGVLEIHGGLACWFLRYCTLLKGGASAMTLGHVVLGRDKECLERTRDHERVHVRQCERWGPFFLPAYILSSLWQLVRGRDLYRDNCFEKEAFGD